MSIYRGYTVESSPKGFQVFEVDGELLANYFETEEKACDWIDGHKRRQGDFSKGRTDAK